MAHISVKYAFTITLKPHLYKQTPDKQYDQTIDQTINKLKLVGHEVTMIVELTKSKNIHMHGIINYNLDTNINRKIIQFYNIFRNDKLIGYVHTKQITDEPGWIEYISKAKGSLIDINRRSIIRDDFNIFNENDYASYGIEW